MGWKLLFVVQHFVVLAHCSMDLTGKIYRTDAALEKENLMFCYECNTMVNGKSCSNFTDKDEYSRFSTKCTGERKTCMVKRYSYTTSNESATSGQQLWSLERNCSGKCEDGCIVIGERIKIYACQACCETPLCNVSNGSSAAAAPMAVVCLAVLFLLRRTDPEDDVAAGPLVRGSLHATTTIDLVYKIFMYMCACVRYKYYSSCSRARNNYIDTCQMYRVDEHRNDEHLFNQLFDCI